MSMSRSGYSPENNPDFSELLKNLYFFDNDSVENSNRKGSSLSSFMGKSLPSFMEKTLSAEILDALWQTRGTDTLQEGMKESFLSPRIMAMALKGKVGRLINQVVLSPDVIIKIKKTYNSKNEARLDFLRCAFVHFYLKFLQNMADSAWQQVCALILWKPFLDFDLDISEADFRKALLDEESAIELLGKFEKVLPYLRVRGNLQYFAAERG